MSRATVLLLAGIVALAGAERPRPNVLFIFTDDQPYKTVGCYPEAPRWVQTPHIDALAASGVRFERTYFGAWCTPSRMSMLTGRLQHACESLRKEEPYPRTVYDPQKAPFVPAAMRAQGYHTAHIGKWHTGIDSGFGRDWDHQIVWNRPKHTANAFAYYTGQIIERDGVLQPTPTTGYATDEYTSWALDYLAKRAQEPTRPWFLWLCYGGVHGPTTPAARHLGSYAGQATSTPADVFTIGAGKPSWLKAIQAWERRADGTATLRAKPKRANNFDIDTAGLTLPAWVHQINECTRSLDEGVGRLVQALRDSGQLDNTLIIYAADQGYALGEHGLNNKLAPYDASISAPLIISQPGVTATGVCAQPVNAPDVVATILARTQVTVPWAVQGHDLTPHLRAPSTVVDRPLLMTYTGDRYGSDTNDLSKPVYNGVPWYALLRHGHYKYVRYLTPDEPEELYDLATDPEELVNLAASSSHRARIEHLRTVLYGELTRSGAGFADRLPQTSTR